MGWLKRFERLDQSYVAEGEEEHVVLVLSDLDEVAGGRFQNADVLTLLSRPLETEDGDFLADQRVQKFHPAILTLSAGFGPPGPKCRRRWVRSWKNGWTKPGLLLWENILVNGNRDSQYSS